MSQLVHRDVTGGAQECRDIAVTAPKARIASPQGRCQDLRKFGKISAVYLYIS